MERYATDRKCNNIVVAAAVVVVISSSSTFSKYILIHQYLGPGFNCSEKISGHWWRGPNQCSNILFENVELVNKVTYKLVPALILSAWIKLSIGRFCNSICCYPSVFSKLLGLIALKPISAFFERIPAYVALEHLTWQKNEENKYFRSWC